MRFVGGFDRTDGYTDHGGPSTAVTAGREKDFCGREKCLGHGRERQKCKYSAVDGRSP